MTAAGSATLPILALINCSFTDIVASGSESTSAVNVGVLMQHWPSHGPCECKTGLQMGATRLHVQAQALLLSAGNSFAGNSGAC